MYGELFHGDATGKISQAEQELMAAHALLKNNFKSSDASGFAVLGRSVECGRADVCREDPSLHARSSAACGARNRADRGGARAGRSARGGCAWTRWTWVRGAWT